MNIKKLDGYFSEDALLFGDPANGLRATRGLSVAFPDMENASTELLNQI